MAATNALPCHVLKLFKQRIRVADPKAAQDDISAVVGDPDAVRRKKRFQAAGPAVVPISILNSNSAAALMASSDGDNGVGTMVASTGSRQDYIDSLDEPLVVKKSRKGEYHLEKCVPF